MKKYLFFTVAAILVFATACNRNNFPEIQTENRTIEYDLEDNLNSANCQEFLRKSVIS